MGNAMSLIVIKTNDSVPLPSMPPRLGWLPVFDTAAIPERDRYDLWRGADIAGLSTRYETTPSEPFAARMEWLDLGTLALGRAVVTAATWDRSRRNVLRDDNDDLVISVRHAGAAIFDTSGRDQTAPDGSIVLVDMSAPRAHLSEASVTTGFALPRALAERTLPPVRSLHGHVIAPVHAALLEAHLNALYRHAGALPASSGPAIAQTVLDLLAVALAASMGSVAADPAQTERALLVRLRGAIEEQLGSPSLTTARLSRSLGVSR